MLKMMYFYPYFWYDSLIKIWSKLMFFKLFLSKSIVNAENRVILPLFLVRFPYKNMVKIQVFDTFLKKSIVMVDFDPYFLV